MSLRVRRVSISIVSHMEVNEPPTLVSEADIGTSPSFIKHLKGSRSKTGTNYHEVPDIKGL